jgi:exosortase D (VPLPA-CTERM-specific)
MVLLSAGLLSYWPVLERLVLRWNSGDDNYCFLVPAIFLYLCWERRESFRFSQATPSGWGLAVLAAGGVVSLVGSLGSVETLEYLGIWLTILGAAVLVYGVRVRRLAFPFVVLLFIVPLPPFLNQVTTFRLKVWATSTAVLAMRAVGMSVYQAGNTLDVGTSLLEVADACSGLRYVMPMVLLALLVGRSVLGTALRTLLALVLVVPVAVSVNALRVAVVGFLVARGYEGVASGFYHDLAGWLVFVVGTVLLLGLIVFMGKVFRRPAESVVSGEQLIGHGSLCVLLGMACALIIAGGIGVRFVPDMGQIPERRPFSDFPMVVDGWKGERNYFSQEIMDSLWADDYVSATFRKTGLRGEIYLLVPYYRYQASRHTAHAPQSCLLGGGWNQVSAESRSIDVEHGKSITVAGMVMEQGDMRMLSTYFFLQRGRVIASPWLNKVYLMWDAATRRRTDGALVRIEMMVPHDEDTERSRAELDLFVKEVWPVLKEYVPD